MKHWHFTLLVFLLLRFPGYSWVGHVGDCDFPESGIRVELGRDLEGS